MIESRKKGAAGSIEQESIVLHRADHVEIDVWLATGLTSGPTGYDELTKQLTDLHGVEGWAAGGMGAGRPGSGRHGTGLHSTGLASAVRTELYALRHRLWALHLLGTERSFSAPLSLTETGVAAALSALLARALRPRHHLGLG